MMTGLKGEFNGHVCVQWVEWSLLCVCVYVCMLACVDTPNTVDWEIFTLKIIRVKNFRVDKFSRFVRSTKFF